MALLSTENFTGTSSAMLSKRGSRDKLLSAHGPTKPIRMNQSTGCPFQNKFREIKFRQVLRGQNVHLKIYLMHMKCFTTQATLRTG